MSISTFNDLFQMTYEDDLNGGKPFGDDEIDFYDSGMNWYPYIILLDDILQSDDSLTGNLSIMPFTI